RPPGKADRDGARPAATVQDPGGRADVLAEESAGALRGAEPHVPECTFLVPDGVGALGRHRVSPFLTPLPRAPRSRSAPATTRPDPHPPGSARRPAAPPGRARTLPR